MNPLSLDEAQSSRFRSMALLCAFLVSLIHCTSWFPLKYPVVGFFLGDGICRMAVPFFFFASGCFLAGHMGERGWYGRELLKRVRTLVMPFFLWCVVYSLLNFGFEALRGGEAYSWRRLATDMGFDPFGYPCLVPLWYVRGLLVLIAVSPFLLGILRGVWRCAGNGAVYAFLLALYVVYGIFAPCEPQTDGWAFFFRRTFPLQGLFYFTCGMAYRLGGLPRFPAGRRARFCLVVGLALVGVKTVLEVRGVSGAFYAVYAAVPFLVAGTIGLMPSVGLPSSVTSCAFPIYVFHYFVVKFVVYVGRFDFAQSFCAWLFGAAFVFGTTFVVVWQQRRRVPVLNGVLWGGR